MNNPTLAPAQVRARLAALRARADERRRRAGEHARSCADSACCECAAAVVPLGVAIDELFEAIGLGGRERGRAL